VIPVEVDRREHLSTFAEPHTQCWLPTSAYQTAPVASRQIPSGCSSVPRAPARSSCDRVGGEWVNEIPAAPNTRARLGPDRLRDRVQALGGSIEVNSRPGDGTAIVVELPLQPD
jgi:hypothetical protein